MRKNAIVDATDVGLSFFGAPGTIVEENEIIAATNNPTTVGGGGGGASSSCRAGISLVDVAPFDGNYTNSIIRNNKIIVAMNSSMDVGIAMGPRAWELVTDNEDEEASMTKSLIYGAQVVNNVLQGDFSSHAMMVAGVQNWTVTENRHVSMKPTAISLWMDTTLSSGIFQSDFNRMEIPTRIYQVRNSSFPCFSSPAAKNQTSSKKGFFFAKIPRTGSTTIAGVHRRIAKNKAAAADRKNMCHAKMGHGSPRLKFDYGNRDVENSFLWTFLRNPADRELSFYFYNVSKLEWEATDSNFQEVSITA